MRLGLRFAEEDREAVFRRGFVGHDAGRVRVTMLLGMAIYGGFSAWDRIIDASAWRTTSLVRAAVVALVLLPLVALTFSKAGKRHIEWLVLLYSAVPAVVLSVIYAMLEDGFSHGAAGIVIVILFVTALLPMRLLFFCGFGAATWAAFALCEHLFDPSRTGLQIINNLYVGTAVGLGVVSVAARERLARRQEQASFELVAAKETADRALDELQAARARLVQSEKLASLGQLVTGIAHEMNTPVGNALMAVTTLGGEAQRLAQAVGSGRLLRSELDRTVAVMTDGVRLVRADLERAVALIQDFRRVASGDPVGELRTLDVGLWLQDFASSLKLSSDGTGYDLRIDAEPGLTVESRPQLLSDVLRRLVANSVTHAFRDAPGRLALTAERIAADRIRFVLADDGIGIAPEHLPRVFDPFFKVSRDRGGPGLGLHIAHSQVAALGGIIEVESQVGVGTRFLIELPDGSQGSASRPDGLRP